MKKFTLILIMFLFANLNAQIFEGISNSMFADIKGHNVGDIITVIIVEQTKSEQNSSSQNSNKSSLTAKGETSGNITAFLPLFGTSASVNNAYDGSEASKQNEKLVGKVTATIVERTASGTLRIEGQRMLEVNGEKNLMKVKGLVRPKDINTDNTVFSYNIADAKIAYKKGNIHKRFIKPGFFQKTITLGLSAGLLGLAYIGFF